MWQKKPYRSPNENNSANDTTGKTHRISAADGTLKVLARSL